MQRETGVPPRTSAPLTYAPAVDADRERELRRLERDRRRREQGKPSYFEGRETTDGWPVLTDASEAPTMVIRPSRLREEAARRDALEQDQFTTADTLVVPPAGQAADGPPARGRGLAATTAIFGAATALSRVLGLA